MFSSEFSWSSSGPFLSYLSIQYFCYVVSFNFFLNYVVAFASPVNDLSLYNLYQHVCRISFYVFCLFYSNLCRYLLILFSFGNIFWFTSFICIVRLISGCLLGIFFFPWVLNVSPSLVVSLVIISSFILLNLLPIQFLHTCAGSLGMYLLHFYVNNQFYFF